MVKTRSFSRLEFVPQYRKRPPFREPRQVRGFDTETREGRAFLITSSTGEVCWSEDLNELLTFLSRFSLRSSLNFFYNLQYDAQSLFAYLSRDELSPLYYLGKMFYKDWKIFYVPRKFLSLQRKSHTVRFYDLYQFFNMSLEKASSKYLGEHKLELDVKQFSDPDYISTHLEEIEAYCLQDARLLEYLGRYFQKLCLEAGVDFNRPISPASVSERHFKQSSDLPIIENRNAQASALRTYYGGRFEVMRRGYIPKAYSFDINSAYPAVMSQLMNLNKGTWEIGYKDDITYEYGFVRAFVTLDDPYLCPLPFDTYRCLIFPRMKARAVWMTLDEVRFIRKHQLGTVKIKDGWFWTVDEGELPFERLVDLYHWRKRLKEDENPLELVVKLIMNSIYGKTVQLTPVLERVHEVFPDRIDVDIIEGAMAGSYKRYYRTGQLFNPAYASLITTRVRLQCHEALLKHGADAIAVFTDGILTSRKRLPISNRLGQWNLEGSGELVMIGTGVYTLDMGKKLKSRFRGFHSDQHLNFFELLAQHADKTVITFPKTKVVQLGEWLMHFNQWNEGELNTFVNLTKRLDLNFDTKRDWSRAFRNARDVLSSEILSQTLLA